MIWTASEIENNIFVVSQVLCTPLLSNWSCLLHSVCYLSGIILYVCDNINTPELTEAVEVVNVESCCWNCTKKELIIKNISLMHGNSASVFQNDVINDASVYAIYNNKNRENVWCNMNCHGYPRHFINVIKSLYCSSTI